MQAHHNHVLAGVLSWVLDRHFLKYLMIRTQNAVRPGPRQPPLFHHHPRYLILIPRSPLREEVCRDVLKPHRLQRYCNILIKSLSVRSLQVRVEVSRKNQFCPPWPLHHRRHRIPNCCVVEWCKVTSGAVVLSCVCYYRPAMVVIADIVVVVTVFFNVVAVVVLGLGRPPNGPLLSCHPPNGENTKAWV